LLLLLLLLLPAAIFGEHALVMIKDPTRHKYLRTLITPAYTPENIAALVPRMEAVVAKYLARWAGLQGGQVKAAEELKLFTFEFIVAVSAYGGELKILAAHSSRAAAANSIVSSSAVVVAAVHQAAAALCSTVLR
jgi:cytochrome P450